MNLGQRIYAVVDSDGQIMGSPEGKLISDDPIILQDEIDVWQLDKDAVRIVPVRLVEDCGKEE